MSKSVFKNVVLTVVGGVILSGCAVLNLVREPDARWADFESWTEITAGTEPTGDPSNLLGQVHKGPDGYRNVFVNDIGKDTLLGDPPYDFPEGTVVVKQQFDNKADWESGKGGDLTVSVKSADDGTRNADNWTYAAGLYGKATASAFCSSCHAAALSLYSSDYVFTTAEFLERHSN